MRKIILVFLTIFLNAQDLADLIKYSYDNELINIKQNQVKTATIDKSQATSKYLPSVYLEGGYLRNDIDRFMTEPSENVNVGLGVEFLIFDGGKRGANLDMLELKKELSQLDLQESKNKMAYEISKLYFAYNSLSTLLEYKKQYSNYLKNATNMVDKLQRAGLKSIDELKVLEANYQLALTDERDCEINLDEVLLNLKKLTNQDITPSNSSTLLEIDDLSDSLQLKMLDKQISIASKKVRQSKSHYFPTIFLKNKTTYHINEFGLKMPDIPFLAPTIKPLEDKYFKKNSLHNTFMVGFRYDLFSFGANSKQTQIDKINLLSLQNKMQYEKRALALDNESIKSKIKNLQSQIIANKLRVDAADVAFNSVEKKYEAGLISYVEYLNALELKFKAKAAYEFSKSNYEIAKAKYYYINGIEIIKKVR